MSKAQLIYIMGRGHSGSTVLDAIIGNAENVESVGELISGVGGYNRLCSCGVNINDCKYWTEVRMEFEKRGMSWEEDIKKIVHQAHIKKFIKTLIVSKNSKFTWKIRQAMLELANSIGNVSGKKVIVDSSKEHTRGLFLAR